MINLTARAISAANAAFSSTVIDAPMIPGYAFEAHEVQFLSEGASGVIMGITKDFSVSLVTVLDMMSSPKFWAMQTQPFYGGPTRLAIPKLLVGPQRLYIRNDSGAARNCGAIIYGRWVQVAGLPWVLLRHRTSRE